MKAIDNVLKKFASRKTGKSATPGNTTSGPPEGTNENLAKDRSPRTSFFRSRNSDTAQKSRSATPIPQSVEPQASTSTNPPLRDEHQRASAKETVLENASPIMTILKDGSEALKDIPYIKAIAGVTHTVLAIRKDIKDIDERTVELLGVVKRRSENLIESLEQVVKSGSGALQRIEAHLQEYEKLLKKIEADLEEMKGSGSMKRWLERDGSRGRIESYIRRMDEFDRIFTTTALTELLGQMTQRDRTKGAPPTEQRQFKDGQPPAPPWIFGRDTELTALRELLLNNPSPRVAILGPGGIGKTTIVRRLMNDPDILEQFPTPLFVSCENVSSVTSILHAIADVLHLTSDQRGESLQVNILQLLRSQSASLLCLDNFEDAWDPPEARAEVETLLAVLGGVSSLGLLVTMRGSERPFGIDWTYPPPEPLQPLEEAPALDLFYKVSQIAPDERVPQLLADVENVPICIQLLARHTQLDGLDDVLKRWKKQGLGAVNRGDKSDTRLTSVTASIELSLQSPRIKNIPHIMAVLRMLAVLPDGLADSMVEALQALLPQDFDLARCLRELKRASLCYQDANKRYRILAPIRQHVESSITLEVFAQDALRSTFFQHINGSDDTSRHLVVVPELANIRLFLTSSSAPWDDCHVEACLDYLWWESYIFGIQDIHLALQALSHTKSPILEVRLRLRISEFLCKVARHVEAATYLLPALSVKTGDAYWEGSIRLELGTVQMMHYKYEEAAVSLQQAVDIFKKINRPDWEASALETLGDSLSHQGHLLDAEKVLLRSLELAKRTKGGVGLAEGNALLGLGDIYCLTNRVPEAKERLRQAITIAERYRSARNKAMALRSLGVIERGEGSLEDAEKSFLVARELFVQLNNKHGEATVLFSLGELYGLMEGRLDAAERYARDALAIFQELNATEGEAYAHGYLGTLFFHQDRAFEALTHLVLSMSFYLRRLHSSQWQQVTVICAQIQSLSEDSDESEGSSEGV